MKLGRDRARVDTAGVSFDAGQHTTVLTGTVWYEDQRVLGRHRQRRDLDGQPGRGRRARERRHQDFLGGMSMQVDVFEVDGGLALGRGCRRLEPVGRTTVAVDGSFSVVVPERDDCQTEADEAPRFVIQVSTQYCEGEVCVTVGRRRNRPFALWFGFDAPLAMGPGDPARNALLFRPEGVRRPPSVEAQAANHFASLIDSVWAIHVEGGVPFRLDPYGPLHVRFPSIWSSGRATSATLIDASNEGWPKGNLLLHEYGHIVHRRAWGGDYAGYPDPIQAWNPARHSAELPFISLKEGWAIFLSNYALGRCDRPRYDVRDDLHSEEVGRNGRYFPQNHHHLLCDLVDDGADRPGESIDDTVALDLYTLWSLFDQVDDRLDEYPHHDPVTQGLDVCDLMQVYILAGSKDGPAGAERALREAYSLLSINDIWCADILDRYAALPVPSDPPTAVPSDAPAGSAPPDENANEAVNSD